MVDHDSVLLVDAAGNLVLVSLDGVSKFFVLHRGARDQVLTECGAVTYACAITANYATGIAAPLQQVLDDWGFLSPQLQDLYDSLNAGRARHADFAGISLRRAARIG